MSKDVKSWLFTILVAVVIVAIPYASIAAFASVTNSVANSYANKSQAQAVEVPPTTPKLLELVNKEREKVGVKPLQLHPILGASAQYKADDMVAKNYFSHYGPDGQASGLDYLQATQNGLCSYISENIHMREIDTTSEAAVKGWMGSEPHRLAMLGTKYTYTGFGVSGNKVVEHFCVAN